MAVKVPLRLNKFYSHKLTFVLYIIILARNLQGSVLEPILYILYTNDLPEFKNTTTVVTFADKTAILAASGSNDEEAAEELQKQLSQKQKWRVKLNESKSIRIYFTGKHFDFVHVKNKRKELCIE